MENCSSYVHLVRCISFNLTFSFYIVSMYLFNVLMPTKKCCELSKKLFLINDLNTESRKMVGIASQLFYTYSDCLSPALCPSVRLTVCAYVRLSVNFPHSHRLLENLRTNFYHPVQNASLGNTQVPRYLLFCEGGIYSIHAHTSVGTKLTSFMGKTS